MKGGDTIYSTQEYLHRFWTKFEHEFGFGGGSGDSGGIFIILNGNYRSYINRSSSDKYQKIDRKRIKL